MHGSENDVTFSWRSPPGAHLLLSPSTGRPSESTRCPPVEAASPPPVDPPPVDPAPLDPDPVGPEPNQPEPVVSTVTPPSGPVANDPPPPPTTPPGPAPTASSSGDGARDGSRTINTPRSPRMRRNGAYRWTKER